MSFYRKYRPQKFNDLIGQEPIVTTLANALSQDRVAHAYLFSGPRGVGKTTMARLLAKTLNCSKKSAQSEPCGVCESCLEIMQDKSLDVIEIDAASNRGIDEIRELREKIKFAPTKSKYKVYIIDEVHMLTKEAFNALLKTLEEPPKHAIFIMATTELHKVPATILSRVQQFDFKRAGITNILKYLEKIASKEKIKIASNALRLIAASAEGSYRDAASILDQVASFDKEGVTLEKVQEILGITDQESVANFIDFLACNDKKQALNLVNDLFLEGFDMNQFNHNIIEVLRKILVYKSDANLLNKAELTEEQKLKIINLSQKLEIGKILEMIGLFIESGKDIKGSNLPQLPLELAIMEICRDDIKQVNVIPKADDKKMEAKDKTIKPKQEEKVEAKIASVPEPEKSEETKTQNIKKDSKPVDSINLKKKWPEVIQGIKDANHSLHLLFKESEPLKISDGKIILAVKYKFYAERIADKKNYQIILKILNDVFQSNYGLECQVDENLTIESGNKNTTKLVNDTLEIFS